MTETSTTHILTTYTHNLPATHLISKYLTNSLIFSFINKHPYIHSVGGGDQTNKKNSSLFHRFLYENLVKETFSATINKEEINNLNEQDLLFGHPDVDKNQNQNQNKTLPITFMLRIIGMGKREGYSK